MRSWSVRLYFVGVVFVVLGLIGFAVMPWFMALFITIGGLLLCVSAFWMASPNRRGARTPGAMASPVPGEPPFEAKNCRQHGWTVSDRDKESFCEICGERLYTTTEVQELAESPRAHTIVGTVKKWAVRLLCITVVMVFVLMVIGLIFATVEDWEAAHGKARAQVNGEVVSGDAGRYTPEPGPTRPLPNATQVPGLGGEVLTEGGPPNVSESVRTPTPNPVRSSIVGHAESPTQIDTEHELVYVGLKQEVKALEEDAVRYMEPCEQHFPLILIPSKSDLYEGRLYKFRKDELGNKIGQAIVFSCLGVRKNVEKAVKRYGEIIEQAHEQFPDQVEELEADVRQSTLCLEEYAYRRDVFTGRAFHPTILHTGTWGELQKCRTPIHQSMQSKPQPTPAPFNRWQAFKLGPDGQTIPFTPVPHPPTPSPTSTPECSYRPYGEFSQYGFTDDGDLINVPLTTPTPESGAK